MDHSIMKSRSSKAKESFQSDRGESSTSTSLDKNLWGTLQQHIDLAENVYSKLPFEEFFHLRTVCKDWYVIACKRLGLKEPIHKPFFNLFTEGEDGRLDGILIYNALSRSWDWRPGRTHNPSFHSVASEGVVYSGDELSLGTYAGAFYWQSKIFQNLDPPPTPPSMYDPKVILGMTVSEKQGPFRSFRVVRGSPNFDTQVYESGVWQTKPCRLPKSERGGPLWASTQASTECADCNGRVYITTVYSREIFVYDFETSRWSTLFSPSDWVSNHPRQYCLDTSGAWNSRVFDVTCDFVSEENWSLENWSLQVWELVDETLHKWKVYDCMPKALCSWLRSTRGFLPVYIKAGDVTLQASFCGDFLLVYSWDFRNGSAGRFCLFNMATKNWQKLNIAAGAVAITDASDLAYSDHPVDAFDFNMYAYELTSTSSLWDTMPMAWSFKSCR